ncbi:MAG: hypothetical protein U1F57_02940 [bacterium]
MKKIILLGLFLSLSFSAFSKDKKSQEITPETGGVPGQIGVSGNGYTIYFEGGVIAEWFGSKITLKDAKKSLPVNLKESVEGPGAKESLGGQIIEQDLGGTRKKKAPLAYKNPKVREIKLATGGDPLKSSGMQPSKVSEEKTPEGGTVTTSDYPDGSKNVVYASPNLKEENSYDKQGTLVWRNMEGEDKGLRYKKTQWEEGSLIREFSNVEGTLSMVFDAQRDLYTFTFLNSKQETVKEIVCRKGECE